ncbi:MAG: hypothetical protein ACPGJV_15575 [Bacteriovoracaceae bacterium]
MKHLFIIDPIEKLVVEKDSTLMWAHTLKDQGEEVFVSFDKDWSFSNDQDSDTAPSFQFESVLNSETFYVEKFEIKESLEVSLDEQTIIYFRKDPPFDKHYLHLAWILRHIERKVGLIINSPEGVLQWNEKLIAYDRDEGVIETFIGQNEDQALEWLKNLKGDVQSLIIKPLDLYQGIGVEKIDLSEFNEGTLKEKFSAIQKQYEGHFVLQPYLKSVEEGEIRSVFSVGKHIGSIIKVPPKGEFLANIARGASYSKIELSKPLMKECEKAAKDLREYGVELVAFDILDNKISEINITCPGLLVELSSAHEKNLCLDIIETLK